MTTMQVQLFNVTEDPDMIGNVKVKQAVNF